jgi:5'-methylthioadenosine phosphorylase
MPEAKLAREAQICYCLVALVSDYDCWRPSEQVKDKQTLLAEILGNLQTAGENAISVITDFLETDAEIISRDCTCRKSLELAVLTDKNKIDSKKQKELNVLFG